MNKNVTYLKRALSGIHSLSFTSQSDLNTGWNGSGNGNVEIEEKSKQLIFKEIGKWKNSDKKQFGFTNTYRWTFESDHVTLEHLRFGAKAPVLLFRLVADSQTNWHSSCPHKCDLDLYSATLVIEDKQVILRWKVEGPRKNEEITYWYKITQLT
jgi:hypothetical protein